MVKQYLECGKIVSTHGIGGEIKVQPWSDEPEFLCGFRRLYLNKGKRALEVESVRIHKNMALIKFSGVDNLDQAVTLRGSIVYINREDDTSQEDGRYYIQDLIGLEVRDSDTGKIWGTLKDVFSTGANDVYSMTAADDGRELLFPAISDVILHIDIAAGVMQIRPLEGLFDAD